VNTGFGMWEQLGETLVCRGELGVVGNGDIGGTIDRIQDHDSLQETRKAASAVETVPGGILVRQA